MSEEKEVAELTQMIATGGGSLRESPITHSKFMRWQATEDARAVGAEVRAQLRDLGKLRQEQLDAHKAYGSQLKHDGKAQLAKNKQVAEEYRQQFLAQGKSVKAEVAALKQAKAMSRAQWEAHGKEMAKAGREREARIRGVRGEGNKGLMEKTAAIRAEEIATNQLIIKKREQILEENRAEVAAIRKTISDEVTDESKKIFFEKRKAIASNTRAAEEAWAAERADNQAKHQQLVKERREELWKNRNAAKIEREKIIEQNRVNAVKHRQNASENKAELARLALTSATGAKGTHDSLYRQKFVSAEDAKKLMESPYAAFIP